MEPIMLNKDRLINVEPQMVSTESYSLKVYLMTTNGYLREVILPENQLSKPLKALLEPAHQLNKSLQKHIKVTHTSTYPHSYIDEETNTQIISLKPDQRILTLKPSFSFVHKNLHVYAVDPANLVHWFVLDAIQMTEELYVLMEATEAAQIGLRVHTPFCVL